MTLGLLASGVATAGPPTGGALPPQLTMVVAVAGIGEIPIDAVGAAVNVTVTNPARAGYVTVHPCRDPAPVASNLNYLADQTVPNLVISGLDVDGDLCITTNATTDLIVDVAGYVPAGSPIVPLAQPVRFLDTREGRGAPRARIGRGQVVSVPVAGTPGVPADAGTVIFNTTVVTPSSSGFVSVFPCGQPLPATSSVNFTANTIVPNLTIAAVGAGGSVCLYTTSETDLVADVAAYVPAGAAGLTMLPAPQRILDTRIGLGGPAAPVAGDVRSVQVGGASGVPAGASAALVNLTATEGAAPGFAAAFPCGVGVPLVSNLNFGRNQNVANAAVVKLAPDGTMCLTANQAVHAVVDVAGYVTGTAALVPVTPRRLLDTREGVEPACALGARLLRPAESPTPAIELYDLATGASRGRPSGMPAFGFIQSVLPTTDCRVEVSGILGNAGVWVSLDANGALLEQRTQPQLSSWTMRSQFGGLALVTRAVFDAAVVDTRTSATRFVLQEFNAGGGQAGGPGGYLPLGVTSDESLFAFGVILAGSERGVFYVDGDGRLLGVLPIGLGRWPIAMAPDGSMLLLFDSLRSPRSYVVTTLDGEEIASVGEDRFNAELSPMAFMTSGAIVGCSPDGTRAMRWDIHTPPKPLAPTRLPCGVVGV